MAGRSVAPGRTRGRHFPNHYKLEWLLRTFDPAIGPFQVEMFRRNARDLRKWLEGPEAFYDVPPGSGLRGIELPRGWEIIFHYEDPGPFGAAGKVTAFFRPPKEETSPEQSPLSAAEPAIDAEGTPPAEIPALVKAPLA